MSDLRTTWNRALPEDLPEDEAILWQGRPHWRGLAVRALHARKVAVYFALVALWMAGDSLATGAGWAAALAEGLSQVAIGGLALAVLATLAWFMGRTAVYTLTDRRLVLRIGVALPVTVNLPFARVDAADVRRYRDGTGDLVLTLAPGDRVSYLLFWPHVRPWSFDRPKPALRCVPDVDDVAECMAQALAASQGRREAAARVAANTDEAVRTSAAATG